MATCTLRRGTWRLAALSLPPILPCRTPVLLSATQLGPNTGYACVKVGAGWATLKCSACFGGKCIAAPVCNITPAPARSLLGEATCKEGVLCNLGTALEGSTSYR